MSFRKTNGPSSSSQNSSNPNTQHENGRNIHHNSNGIEEQVEEGEANPTQILRSIASYLSLSDAESIGSLYSMMSPHPYHLHSPRMRRSASVFGSHPYNSSSSSAGMSHSRFLPGGGGGGGVGASGGVYGSNHMNIRFGSNATLASIDNDPWDDVSDDDSQGGGHGKESPKSTDENSSGPDAAAGLGNSRHDKMKWGLDSDTPGLIALSPVPLDEEGEEEDEEEESVLDQPRDDEEGQDSPSVIYDWSGGNWKNSSIYNYEKDIKRKAMLHRKRIQEKLKDEVFRHPQSIRSYCLSSQRAAAKMKRQRSEKLLAVDSMSCVLPTDGYYDILKHRTNALPPSIPFRPYESRGFHFNIFEFLVDSILDNIPLSILLDATFQTIHVSFQVTHASFSLTTTTAEILMGALAHAVHQALWIISQNLNPFTLLSNILSFQRKAMGMTGEVIVTGIQSVATGVGSAYPMSRAHGFGSKMNMSGLSPGRGGMMSVGQSLVGGLLRNGSVGVNLRDGVISDKVYRKLNKINPAAKVITYIERDDEVLTTHAKKRVQRMMHYNVPLRPFIATVEVTPIHQAVSHPITASNSVNVFDNVDFVPDLDGYNVVKRKKDIECPEIGSGSEDVVSDENDSPFMCTPKSFPPTPSSRAHVLARGTRFAEDIVFLARDQLRVEEGLESENEQTRAMAKALREGRRLAVFNASDIGSGIHLSCGQHCASKIGNDLYSSARGMIPVLRNSFVYFEMTVSTPPLLSMVLHHASLSIGLSTLEMPLNALVGAWKGSVGLCSTGQILAGSQWCSPLNPKTYGSNCTIGCLVYLDDDSAFETWDGLMVVANIVFNVDGHIILPGASSRSEDLDERLSPVMPIFVPRDEELFPTLTLHSTQTEVMCRFCSEDITASSRAAIGAPDRATVYAVDGSVLFEDNTGFESTESNEDVSYSEDSDSAIHEDHVSIM